MNTVHTSQQETNIHPFIVRIWLEETVEESGQAVWRAKIGAPIWSSPAVGKGIVCFVCNDGHVYALDARSGEERWKTALGGRLESSPVIAGDHVYVGGESGGLYVLDAQSGTIRSQVKVRGAVVNSPVPDDAVVYFGSTDGTLYAAAVLSPEELAAAAEDQASDETTPDEDEISSFPLRIRQ